jgi:hypothetical protein
MKLEYKKVFWGILGLMITAALLTGCATCREDGQVKFRVKGKVLDKDAAEPLDGVEVLLLFDKKTANNKKTVDELFELYTPMSSMGEDPMIDSEWFGTSGKNGEYITEASKKYPQKNNCLFGIKRFSVQPQIWLAFRKKGYQMKVLEVKTTGWKNADLCKDAVNEIPDVNLTKEIFDEENV